MRFVLVVSLAVVPASVLCGRYYEPNTGLPPAGVLNERPRFESTVQDRFPSAATQVDVLFVLDPSDTMAAERGAIAASFGTLLEPLEEDGADFHIGVLAGGGYPDGAGQLEVFQGIRWVNPDTPDPTQVLQGMAMAGPTPLAQTGRDAVYQALEIEGGPEGFNVGFRRPEAALHLVFLSNRDDPSGLPYEDFVDWLEGLEPWPGDLSVHAIVSEAPTCPSAEQPGHDYLALAEAFDGEVGSVCDVNFRPVVADVGTACTQPQEWFLTSLPVPESLHVTVAQEEVLYELQSEDVVYDKERNSVSFPEFVPAPSAEVIVDYDLLVADEA